jgi:hypothetical protein
MRTVVAVSVHELARRGLNEVVDVDRRRAGMRPQARVHLLRLDDLVDGARSAAQQRPELGRLTLGQLGHARHVPLWLQDQCSDVERSDGVLDQPVAGLVDDAPGQRTPPFGQIAGEAAFHLLRD